MRRRLAFLLRLVGAACLAAFAGQRAEAAETRGGVTIQPAVGAKVTQNVLSQLQISVGFNGAPNVASISVPGAVTATGQGGSGGAPGGAAGSGGGDSGQGGVQLPTLVAPDGSALAVPPDTNVSIDTSGAAPGDGPFQAPIVVLVQYN